MLPSGSPDTVGASDFGYFGAHKFGIPSLHVPLSNASSAGLPPPSHGSGPGWFATPFLYDSFIHYFTPVYPDTIQPRAPAPPKMGRHLWRKNGMEIERCGGRGSRTFRRACLRIFSDPITGGRQ